VVEPL